MSKKAEVVPPQDIQAEIQELKQIIDKHLGAIGRAKHVLELKYP